MKKLNLKLKGIGEMLGREQLKRIVGGYDAEPICEDECTTASDCPTPTAGQPAYSCIQTACGGQEKYWTCV